MRAKCGAERFFLMFHDDRERVGVGRFIKKSISLLAILLGF
jgi:hypothetical protein